MPNKGDENPQGNAAENNEEKKDLLQAPEEDTKTTKPVKETDEVKELRKQLKAVKEKNEDLEMKVAIKSQTTQDSPEMQKVLEHLQEEINSLKKEKAEQPVVGFDGKRQKYRKPTKDDILPDGEAVTFTARFVMYVVGSFMDEAGIEHIAPFKMIKFIYAAADIKHDGKEDSIINFCTYTTRLKPEIDFLRENPQYGLMYSENMNEVATMDHKEFEFKSRVAAEVGNMAPESILEHARVYKIPGYETKAVKSLRPLVAAHIVKDYVKEAAQLQKDRLLKMQLQKAV